MANSKVNLRVPAYYLDAGDMLLSNDCMIVGKGYRSYVTFVRVLGVVACVGREYDLHRDGNKKVRSAYAKFAGIKLADLNAAIKAENKRLDKINRDRDIDRLRSQAKSRGYKLVKLPEGENV